MLTAGLRPAPRLTRILPINGADTRIRTLTIRLEGVYAVRYTISAFLDLTICRLASILQIEFLEISIGSIGGDRGSRTLAH